MALETVRRFIVWWLGGGGRIWESYLLPFGFFSMAKRVLTKIILLLSVNLCTNAQQIILIVGEL